MSQIKSPFTDEQVRSFNEYQVSGVMHDFTCGNDNKTEQDHLDGGRGTLVATKETLQCPYCDYKQDWMHNWMGDYSWKKMKLEIPKP